MPADAAEVVIIGAGSTGLSAAYELARAGVDALVVDKKFIGTEATGRNPGGIRQIGRDVDEVPLMVAAMKRWHEIEDELDHDVELTQDGYLWAALTQEQFHLQQGLVSRDKPYGIEEYALTQEEIQELAPAISDVVVGGLYSPTDCIANPFLVGQAYYQAAQRHGARFLLNTEVTGLRISDRQVAGVVTQSGEIRTHTVIVAAGPWSAEISRMAGIEVPVTPCPNQIIITAREPQILPPFLLVSNIAVCRQLGNGQVMMGNTNAPSGITGYSQATHYGELARTVTSILKIVPAFRNLKLIRTWVGTIAFTPDDNFIFGRVDEVSGLILACGFSGHGFALTPIIGQLLCELVVNGKTSLPTDAFRLSRFDQAVTKKRQHFAHQHVEGV